MQIETGIPIPAPKTRGDNSPSVIMRKMQIGDSVVVAAKSLPSWRSVAVMLRIKVTTRKIDSVSFRIWRTA